MNKDLDKILNITTGGLAPSKGRVLISNPFLSDYFFRRAVVLLIEHGADGSFGVIINKPLEVRLDQVTKSLTGSRTLVSMGGPVKTEGIFYLHTLGDRIPDSLEILDGLYWGGDVETLNLLMLSDATLAENKIRFFIGYAGWVTNQLNEELINRSWVIAETDPDEVIGSRGVSLWHDKVRALGKPYQPWLNFPPDPSFN